MVAPVYSMQILFFNGILLLKFFNCPKIGGTQQIIIWIFEQNYSAINNASFRGNVASAAT